MVVTMPMNLVVVISVLGLAQLSSAEVAMVFTVQRHGARNALAKTPYLAESDSAGGPSLLPQGQRQAYQAGRDYQQRYINSTTCGNGGNAAPGISTCLLRWGPSGSVNGDLYGLLNSPNLTPNSGFNNYNTLFRASGLDRTLQTARGFLAGVFPSLSSRTNIPDLFVPTGEQIVPVYSTPDNFDNTIRAYTKCPTYANRLNAWYNTTEFQSKADASSQMRTRVQSLYPSVTNARLDNWWNVYDVFSVWADYQQGQNLTVPADLLAEMTDLGYWLEITKMRSNMTGSLLGGTMLQLLRNYLTSTRDVMLRAAATPQGNAQLALYQLLGFAAHYNTQLAMLSALKLDTYQSALTASTLNGSSWLATGMLPAPGVKPKLPALASVIAFELHVSKSAAGTAGVSSATDLAVRLAIQDGPGQPYVSIPLPCQTNQTSALGGPDACSLPDFLTYIQDLTLASDSAWCNACQNTDMVLCLAAKPAPSCGTSFEAWQIAVAVVISVVGTALLCAGLTFWWLTREQKHALAGEKVAEKDMAQMVNLQV